jgi:uncharacterized coiled-coil protein SlyX
VNEPGAVKYWVGRLPTKFRRGDRLMGHDLFNGDTREQIVEHFFRHLRWMEEKVMAGQAELQAAIDGLNAAVVQERSEIGAKLAELAQTISDLQAQVAALQGQAVDLQPQVDAVNAATAAVSGLITP